MQAVDAWLADSPASAEDLPYRVVLSTGASANGARSLVAGHCLGIASQDLLDTQDSWGLACALFTISVAANVADSTVTVEQQDCPDGTLERVASGSK